MNELNELTPISNTDELKNRLLLASSKKELEEVVSLINLDIAKKNIIRSSVYSDMIDKVISEMQARIEKYPGQFSNKDLLEYMNALQSNLSKNQIDKDQVTTIAIQQNNIINVDPLSQFDRESKDKMREVLKSLLAQPIQGDIIEDECIKEGSNGIYGGVQVQDISLQEDPSN